MNTCDPKQKLTTPDCYNQPYPQLTLQNITLKNGNSQVRQSLAASSAAGAAARCSPWAASSRWSTPGSSITAATSRGPTSAARRSARWPSTATARCTSPATRSRGGRCSNGGALSSIGVSWVVTNSVMTGNKAIGFGANPAASGTAGGGSGGAIYTDGDKYKLKIVGTVIRNNHAREGGGAIFFVSNNNTGWLTIKNSALHDNPSAVFWTRPYPGIYFHSAGHPAGDQLHHQLTRPGVRARLGTWRRSWPSTRILTTRSC